MVVVAVGSMMADGKLSPWLRRAAQTAQPSRGMRRSAATDTMVTIAFIRISGDADAILAAHGGRSLACFGDIHIAMLPIGQLKALAALDAVQRIEARRPCSLLLDSTAMHVDALPVYAGRRLPHPLTGRGVVMGVMDIGFDLTHPSFYTADMSEYRIKALWDQLSIDTAGSELPVGADYVGREAIVGYGHTRDGHEQTHGTHTLGIAAGTGYDRPYRGMAYESDICLVANAVTEDVAFVDSADYYKYTSATDALGFKYIFDYAAAHGQPCVISFSEGTYPDLSGDDQLFYAVLDSLCGPGRIIVAAAGNRGHKLNYFHKLRGELSAGTYFDHDGTSVMFQLLGDGPFDLRIVAHGEQNDTIVMPSRMFVALPDSEYIDTLALGRGHYSIDVAAYPSCYHPADSVYEVFVRAPFKSS